jgi:hypothetical protein
MMTLGTSMRRICARKSASAMARGCQAIESELGDQCSDIVGEGVEIITGGRLVGAAMAATIMERLRTRTPGS